MNYLALENLREWKTEWNPLLHGVAQAAVQMSPVVAAPGTPAWRHWTNFCHLEIKVLCWWWDLKSMTAFIYVSHFSPLTFLTTILPLSQQLVSKKKENQAYNTIYTPLPYRAGDATRSLRKVSRTSVNIKNGWIIWTGIWKVFKYVYDNIFVIKTKDKIFMFMINKPLFKAKARNDRSLGHSVQRVSMALLEATRVDPQFRLILFMIKLPWF